MLIRKLDPATFVNAYNVDLQLLYPWEGVVTPPFGAAWAILAPGESTKPHAHQECETFFIATGHGRMSIGADQRDIGPGDVTFHTPFDNHVLENTGDEPLRFLTVYWEDRAQWGEAKAKPVQTERMLVTAAPPTPNGDLHLGHLAGPYLSGDYFTRYQRLRGVDARFVFGSDDNCMFVEGFGKTLGLGPQETADRLADEIQETLAMAGVELTAFPRPNASPYHIPLVQEFFRRLYDAGELEERVADAPHSATTGEYLYEAFIRGRCPSCGEGVVGNTCEACAWINDSVNLLDPVCTFDGQPPVMKPCRRLVFPLSRHTARLRDYYRRVSLSPHVRALCEQALERGLPDMAVTHPASWGIPVPVAGWEDQRIYVWMEMAPRYFAYARHLNDAVGAEGGIERFWKSPEAEIVEFFGFDNSFYYTIVLPALFLAYDSELRLPTAFITNEFYRLDGLKFSTTRNHRIMGRELLAEAPRDAVRFYLAHTCPEREGTNFTRADFRAVLTRELQDTWLTWLADLGRRLVDVYGGKVPATGDWTADHRAFMARLEGLVRAADVAYGVTTFSPQRATLVLCEVVREARRFAAGEAHWSGTTTRTEERRTAFALEALAAKLLGLLAAPILPDFAARLWTALGFAAGPGDGEWKNAAEWVPAGADASGLATADLLPGLRTYLA